MPDHQHDKQCQSRPPLSLDDPTAQSGRTDHCRRSHDGGVSRISRRRTSGMRCWCGRCVIGLSGCPGDRIAGTLSCSASTTGLT